MRLIHRMGGRNAEPPGLDASLADVARTQHGVIAVFQLLELGFTHRRIERRRQAGRLIRLYTGVYAAGYRPLTQEGKWMAGVLAVGPGGLLSHRAGAAHWNLIRHCPPYIDVTIRQGAARTRGNLIVHQTTRLDREDIRSKQGIPITSPARTLLDYAEKATPRETERALDENERLGLASQHQIHSVIARCPGRIGGARLSAVIQDHAIGSTATVNDFEELFIALCDEYGIPRPEVNQWLGPYKVDFLWRKHKLIVETDGAESHQTRKAFEADRARDAELITNGYRVLRFTWRQLTREPEWVARKLSTALER